MKKKKTEKLNQMRGLRLSEATWNEFAGLKPRGTSWDLFVKELLDIIRRIKSL